MMVPADEIMDLLGEVVPLDRAAQITTPMGRYAEDPSPEVEVVVRVSLMVLEPEFELSDTDLDAVWGYLGLTRGWPA